MRYRPFDPSGLSISTVSLVLDDTPMSQDDRLALVYAALESGVNGFELATADCEVAATLRRALETVDRSLIVLMLRLPPIVDDCAAAVWPSVEAALTATGGQWFDSVVLEDPAPLAGCDGLEALEQVRDARRARLIGVSGESPAIGDYIASDRLDLLATPFCLTSSWFERNRIREALRHHMTVVGFGVELRAAAPEPRPRGLGRFLNRRTPGVDDGYQFLQQTPGWRADEIGLTFALTEPGLSTVRVRASSAEQMERLAACAERQLPTNVSAQIEMGRLSPTEVRRTA